MGCLRSGCSNKLPQTSCLSNRCLFLSYENWDVQGQGADRARSGESPLPGSRKALLTVCTQAFPRFLHMGKWEGGRRGRGRERGKPSDVSSYKGTNTIMRAPPSCPQLNLITPKAPPPMPPHWEVGPQHVNWEEEAQFDLWHGLCHVCGTTPSSRVPLKMK